MADPTYSDPPVRDTFAKPVVEKPAPILEPVTLFDKDNKPVQVAPHEAPGKILSGEYGYAPGTLVPIKINGQIGTVPAENLKTLSGTSAQTVSGHEFAQAKLQRDYGDFAHQAETYAVNTLDSASLGLSNYAAGQLGGKEVREHLRKINEANPNAAIAGQLTGIVAPIAADVLTGGAATPIVGADIAATIAKLGLRGEEAASAARALMAGGKAVGAAEELSGATRLGLKGAETSRAAEAILGTERALPKILGAGTDLSAGIDAARAAETAAPALAEGVGLGERALGAAKGLPGNLLWGPTRAVSKVGATVEEGIRSIVGTEATTYAGKLAQKLLPQVGKGMAEGAIYNAGATLGHEGIQEDPNVFGEKMLAAVGYGALLGGAVGTLTTAGSAALGRLGDKFEAKSGDLLLKALDKEGKYAGEVEKLPGGLDAFRTKMLEQGMVKGGDRVQDVAARVTPALEASRIALRGKYGELDGLFGKTSAVDGVTERVGSTLSSMEQLVEKTLKLPGELERVANPELAGFGKVKEAVLNDLRSTAGLADQGAHVNLAKGEAVMKAVELTPKEIQDFVQKNPDSPAVKQWMASNFKDTSGFIKREVEQVAKGGAERAVAEDPRMTLAQMAEYADKVRGLGAQAKSPSAKAAFEKLADALQAKTERQTLQAVVDSAGSKEMSKWAEKVLADPNASVGDELMAGFAEPARRGGLNGLQEKAIVEYGRALGDVKHLHLADRMLESSMEKVAKEPGLGASLLEGALGSASGAAIGAGWDLAHGKQPGAKSLGLGALGLAGGVGRRIGMRVLEERGASTGAAFLDKLSVMGNIEQRVNRVNQEIKSSVSALDKLKSVSEKAPEAGASLPGRTLEAKYKAGVEQVFKYAMAEQTADHVMNVARGIRPYSEGAAEAFQRAAVGGLQHLMETMPKTPPLNAAYPNAGSQTPSDLEMAKWLRRYDVVHDPLTPLKGLAKGVPPTQAEVDTFWITNPNLAQHVSNEVETQARNATSMPPYAVQQGTATLTKRGKGMPDATLNALKSSWGGGDEAKGAGKGTFGGGAPQPSHLSKPLNVTSAMTGKTKY